MGEILGLGMTHYPALSWTDEHMTGIFRMTLGAKNVDASVKDPANWPPEVEAELGSDNGLEAARTHRARLVKNFREMRRMIDDFNPDFVVICGDDQHENFQADIIPPFCVMGFDDEFEIQPWSSGFGRMAPNVWGEESDWTYTVKGHREGAKHLTTGMLEQGVDMPYAYQPLHEDGLVHAFANTVLYLDYDRKGFPYPIVPFHVNCYGSAVLVSKGAFAHLTDDLPVQEGIPDPPAPAPWRCMEVGAAMARSLAASPYRVALIASSSWSHSFLTSNTGYMFADRESDRELHQALLEGDYDVWRSRTLAEIEGAGQHELLNWFVVAGAMEELGRKATVHDYFETWVLVSDKCFASWPEPVPAS